MQATIEVSGPRERLGPIPAPDGMPSAVPSGSSTAPSGRITGFAGHRGAAR